MWTSFETKKRELFKLCNGKEICIWGYGYGGRFLEHLFRRENKKIEYVIDNSGMIDHKLNLEHSFIFKELDKDTHIILVTFIKDRKVVEFLTQLGYEENKNLVFVRNWFYDITNADRKLSYYDWLESSYNLDIILSKTSNEKVNNDSLYYSPGIDYSVIDILDNFELDDNDAVFDFGCGKGGVLLLFYLAGISKLGGVEYDTNLYETALSNMQKVKLESTEIIHADAAKVSKSLDKYNYFFMYNPFQGKTFEDVVANLEESYQRNKRVMYIIYSGPYCHETIIKNRIFKFSKTISTDYSVKNVRIYCTS